MSEHHWFQQNLESYAAGGLTAEERERIERHAALCRDCSLDLAEWRNVEGKLDNLFAEVRPPAGLEDRMIQNLRQAPAPRRLFRSPIVRFALGAAAIVLLAGIGAGVYGAADSFNLLFPGSWDEAPAGTQSSNNLKQLPVSIAKIPSGMRLGLVEQHELTERLTETEQLGDLMARTDDVNGIEFYPPALALIVRAPAKMSFTGGLIGGKQKRVAGVPSQELAELDHRMKKVITSANSSITWGKSTPETTLRRDVQNMAPGFGLATTPAKAPPPAKDDARLAKDTTPGTDQHYYRLRLSDSKSDPAGSKTGLGLGRQKLKEKSDDLVEQQKAIKDLGAAKKNADGDFQQPEGGAPANQDGRKIIRTGDVEFEVDSFDKAVERINALIAATKGAFVATTNSDKLPNGKVKGSVVVRVPPENLDKFLTELRKDLGKMGDLKSQRIGSQDITKQYTDVESRLRAARTMEERLLKIIKDGKGEIKDLVAAERELGNWRTKIEEMEGEIRYYNSQVSLSTLTIGLVEKEIQAPSALVVSERVTMRIETEDVEKAQQSAVKAVLDAGGRVTKSELKQHAAGQLEAIVQAEAAPAAGDALRARFKQLGLVTRLDSDRLQQAEGGRGKPGEIKTRQNDVQFNLTLYNVANIQPRETFTVQVATVDVPGSFRKLQDLVGKLKGQTRKGQINEQDKLNISADFDFDIPSQDKQALDKALDEVGRTIARSTAQAPPGDNVTDSKIGYRLTLRDVAGIPARERITLGLVVANVKEVADELKDLVRSAKGMVKADRRDQEVSGKITALLLFDVPLSARDELVKKFEAAGKVRVQQTVENPQVPSNDLATAQIDVTLTNVGPIVPSDEGLWPQVRTSLYYSFKVLTWSLMFIIAGVSLVLPWALVIWGVYRLVRRRGRKTETSA